LANHESNNFLNQYIPFSAPPQFNYTLRFAAAQDFSRDFLSFYRRNSGAFFVKTAQTSGNGKSNFVRAAAF
jgi:hypothetical protein